MNSKGDSVYQVKFHAKGAKVFTVRKHGLIHQWDVASQTLDRPIYNLQELSITAFHPDGRRALMLRPGGNLRWVDLETGAVTGEVERPGRMGGGIEFSPDGRWFFIGEQEFVGSPLPPAGFKKTFEVWETDSGRRLWSAENVRHATFTADSRRLCILGQRYGNRIALLEATSGKLVLTLPSQDSAGFETVLFSPNGHWLVAGTNSTDQETGQNTLSIFDARPLK